MGYVQQVELLGGDANYLLELAGIPPIWLESGDYLIPATKLVMVLELAAEHLDCPDFGLRLASLQSLSMLGPVGLLVQQCDTLGDTLKQLVRFLYIHSQAGLLNFSFEGEFAYISFEPLVDYKGNSKQLVDLSIAVGLQILNELVSKNIVLKSVYFSYREPQDLSVYHETFHCPLTFEREVSGVAISKQVLSWPLNHDSSRISQLVSQYIQDIERANPLQLEDRLRVLIRQLLPLGKCSIEQVSNLLEVDVRTLQRRLKEKSTSYQTLLSDERKQLAIRYLKESDVSMTHLADLLGFSDQSVFSRSFRAWMGLTPTQFLKQEGSRLTLR